MLRQITRKLTRQNLKIFIEKNKSIGKTLDIGCSGSPYAEYFPNRVGLDLFPGPQVHVVGDTHNLPFKDEIFKIALCTEVLEHLVAPENALQEIERVLVRSGKLILTTRFIFPIHDAPHDYYRFTKYGLQYLLRNWQISQFYIELDTMTTIATLIQRIAYQCEFRFRLFKTIIHFIVYLLLKSFKIIIKKEYGSVKHDVQEEHIMTSGYYVVAKKSH